MKKEIATAALLLGLAALTASAQHAGGQGPRPPSPQGGQSGRASMERPAPPNPGKIAALMMEQFDADKDGKLNTTELAAALAAHPPRRPPRVQHSTTNAPQHAAGQAGNQPQGKKHQGPPAPDVLAAKMIEEFAADKTALTLPELQQALAAHRPPQGGPGGRPGGAQGNRQGPPQGAPQQGGPAGK